MEQRWGKQDGTSVLDWLDGKAFTTLFVDGNHENFDRLYAYPVEKDSADSQI